MTLNMVLNSFSYFNDFCIIVYTKMHNVPEMLLVFSQSNIPIKKDWSYPHSERI